MQKLGNISINDILFMSVDDVQYAIKSLKTRLSLYIDNIPSFGLEDSISNID